MSGYYTLIAVALGDHAIHVPQQSRDFSHRSPIVKDRNLRFVRKELHTLQDAHGLP